MPPSDTSSNNPVVPQRNDIQSDLPVEKAVHEQIHVPHKPDATHPANAVAPAQEVVAEVSISTPVATSATAVSPAPVPQPTPPSDAPVVAEITLSIEQKIELELIHQQGLEKRRIDTQVESAQLFHLRKQHEDELAPLLLDEKLAIEKIESLEKKKHESISMAERRKIEAERWESEEKRRAIEEARWPISEKLEAVVGQISDVEGTFKSIVAEEAEGNARIVKLRTEAKQQELVRDLDAITTEREATEAELEEYRQRRDALDEELRSTLERDEAALAAEHIIDTKIDSARTLYEERVLSEERRKLEIERRETEKGRWEAEDAIPDATNFVEESEARLREVKQKEDAVLAKLKALSGQN